MYRFGEIWVNILVLNHKGQTCPQAPSSIQAVNRPEDSSNFIPLIFTRKGPEKGISAVETHLKTHSCGKANHPVSHGVVVGVEMVGSLNQNIISNNSE